MSTWKANLYNLHDVCLLIPHIYIGNKENKGINNLIDIGPVSLYM